MRLIRLAMPFLVALAACSKSPETPPSASAASSGIERAAASAPVDQAESGIAWKNASNDADVDAAFAQARAQGKPVFVYWGAKWCPPCNQVKATLFNRQDFIERSRAFVPVYVDGDSPGAQKVGARFKVSGYPTMVLFNSQGTELTRLPGEVEAQRYTQVLTLGMSALKPVKEVLAQALSSESRAKLTANEWRLLAFYSWDTDEQQLAAKDGVPGLLQQIADACPPDQGETAMRLRLNALAASGDVPSSRASPRDSAAPAALPPASARAIQAKVLELLADESAARAQMDVLTNQAPEITRALSVKGTAQRADLLAAFDVALKRFEADATLSRADRMTSLIAQVDLAKIDLPKRQVASAHDAPKLNLPETLIADIREQTARADREITDGYERQAVITAAAYLLQDAGLGNESDALLKANLAKSHSPYYLMSELAGNAKARGDKTEALRWYEEAFDKSEGPATRLQWGASYLNALIDLSPQDEVRIEKASASLLTEAAALPDAFYERSGRALKRVGKKLQAWNNSGEHTASIKRLQAQLGGVCSGLAATDPHRADCAALLTVAQKKAG